MRIDLLSNHGAMGGGEVMLLQLAGTAIALGHSCRIVGPEGSELAEQARRLDLPFIGVAADGRRSLLRQYRSHARSTDADLLWCNGPVPSMATIGARIPRIVHLHQRPSPSQAILLRLARHGAIATLVPSHTMAAVISGSTALPNWTDAPPVDPARTPAEPGVTRIGFIGRMSTVKGLDVLADAVAMLPAELGAQLLVAGDDRFVPESESAPVRAALGRIADRTTVLGWCDRDTFHAGIDLLVVPSSWEEPFGLVAAEAMARRTPLLVTRSGALPEIVGPDHPWVVPPSDAEALALAITAMIEDPWPVAESVRRAADRWSELYSPEAGRERLGALLDGLGVDAEGPR